MGKSRESTHPAMQATAQAAVCAPLGAAPDTTSTAAYSDGHPQDRVQYLEAGPILKPDRFVSVESFRDFGKLVENTAKNPGVGFIADPMASRRPDVREIIFFDTADSRLYNNAYILHRRTKYQQAWLSLGTTRTGMVYRLKGVSPQNHE